ncbi:MAG: hypothetical protein ABR598_04200 [Candidatus Dormibacteria bacterium]
MRAWWRGVPALVLLPVAVVALANNAAAVDSAQHIATFATTAIAGGVTTRGDVGASGGLVTVDSASAYVSARLDSGPSAAVLAAPAEPGTLVRTVIGQTLTQQTLPVPAAEAHYPGQGSGKLDAVPPSSAGPLSSGGGSATATATADTATGQTTGGDSSVRDAYSSSGSSTDVRLHRVLDDITATSISRVHQLQAGPLILHDVAGTADIQVSGGKHTAVSGITIGSSTVAGVPVTIDNDGIHAQSKNVPLGGLPQTTESLNRQLAASGVAVHTVNATHATTANSADADSGGLIVSVTSPGLPVGGNTLTMMVGRVVETEFDSSSAPAPIRSLSPFQPAGSSSTTVTTPDQPATQDEVTTADIPPTAATNPLARYVVIGGRRLTAGAALLAFALWQMLALGPSTVTTLVRRRRRARTAIA